jgi:hypothetical protein
VAGFRCRSAFRVVSLHGRNLVPAHPARPGHQLPIVRDYLPQVSLTLADTRFTLSLMSRDLPFFPLCVVQRGTMYQLLSPELSF